MNLLTQFWNTLSGFIVAHKFISVIAAVAVAYGGYYTYTKLTAAPTETRYVTTTVATGTVIASVSETGQVSADSNVDVQSKSAGEIRILSVQAGQHVGAGAAIAYLDTTTAEQNVLAAERAVQSAQLALASAKQGLSQNYDQGFADTSKAFLDLPTIMTGLDSVLHDSTVPGHGAMNNLAAYRNIVSPYTPSIGSQAELVENAYQQADVAYQKALTDFKNTPYSADTASKAILTKETYAAVSTASEAVRLASNFLNSIQTAITNNSGVAPSTLAGHISTLSGYATTLAPHVSTLSTDTTNVTGTTENSMPIDIQTSELSLKEKQDALDQAKQALADTVVRAPFSGTVAKLDVQRYQTIGNGTAVATLISDAQSVSISVNEVDAAALKVGQKATITFDALPNISIAGTLSSVNAIGTVSSGVVSYAATVTFDTPNSSVKAGMSATTNIITGTETGLVVPASAVKTVTGQTYVMVFNPPLAGGDTATGAPSTVAPTRVGVVTGLADDSSVIIRSGISAGTQLVTQTIVGAATTQSTAAQSTSVFGGGGAAGGGNVRVFTR